jgi:hypothetical protein
MEVAAFVRRQGLEARQMPRDPQKSLVHGVLGKGVFAQHAQRLAHHGVFLRMIQRFEDGHGVHSLHT